MQQYFMIYCKVIFIEFAISGAKIMKIENSALLIMLNIIIWYTFEFWPIMFWHDVDYAHCVTHTWVNIEYPWL